MLYELLYSSFASEDPARPQTLLEILGESRARNAEHGITGVLLYFNGEFVQLLEGERDKVRWLYHDLIAKDLRHRHPTVAWEQQLQERNFPDWRMGFARLPSQADPHGPALDAYLPDGLTPADFVRPGSTGKRMLRLLTRT